MNEVRYVLVKHDGRVDLFVCPADYEVPDGTLVVGALSGNATVMMTAVVDPNSDAALMIRRLVGLNSPERVEAIAEFKEVEYEEDGLSM
jgi:hypothetical protein